MSRVTRSRSRSLLPSSRRSVAPAPATNEAAFELTDSSMINQKMNGVAAVETPSAAVAPLPAEDVAVVAKAVLAEAEKVASSASRVVAGNGAANGLSIDAVRAEAAAPAVSPASASALPVVSPTYKTFLLKSPEKMDWLDGAPDVLKLTAHIDKLNGQNIELKAMQASMGQTLGDLSATVQALLGENQRLRKDVRAQKLDSNRRWVYAVLLLLAYTIGQPLLQTILYSVGWALENPGEFFPTVVEGLVSLAGWQWMALFPLALMLFVRRVHKMFSSGRMGLMSTFFSTFIGVLMQLPLLYVVLRSGLGVLQELKSSGGVLADSRAFYQMAAVGAFVGTALFDALLVLLHLYL